MTVVLDWRLAPAHWAAIEGAVPKLPGTKVDDRRCLEAMLWRLALQKRWNDIPSPPFPSAFACWSRHARWERLGAVEAIWAAFLAPLAPAKRAAWQAQVAAHGFAPHKARRDPDWRRRARPALRLPEIFRVRGD